MKTGTYQTDSLPRIVVLGGVHGLSDAAEPDAKGGKVKVDRPHPATLFQPLLYRVATGSRTSFYQMTHETPSRRCTGRFEIIRILFGLLLASHVGQEKPKDDEVLNKCAFSCWAPRSGIARYTNLEQREGLR